MRNMHPVEHFKTVYEHRKLVREHCFRLGLYRQGLLHDLSKYSPVEFWRGAVYYQGNRSPNNKEREVTGHSMAWLHHKGRNKHHFEYWIDYIINEDGSVGFGGNKMPKRYIAEMFCDRVAASKIYRGEKYRDSDPLDYFLSGKERKRPIHPRTEKKLHFLLKMLAEQGEEKTFAYIRRMKK